MPFTRILALLLLTVSFESYAFNDNSFSLKPSSKESIPQSIMGLSTYAGYMTTGEDASTVYAGASLYAYFFNGALEIRANKEGFDNDNQIQPYMGFGLGRFLQLQRGVDFTTTNRVRIVSEIAFDEFIDTRHHITLQGFVERIDTSSKQDKRYGIALGYTF